MIRLLEKIIQTQLKFLLLVSATLIITAGCSPPPPARLNRLQWASMGTIAAVQSGDLDTAQQLRTLALDEFAAVERELSGWSESSTLAEVNRHAGGEGAVPISQSFSEIFKLSAKVTRESGGAFNPLIAPVLRIWGFNGATPPAATPSTEVLQRALALACIDDVELTASSNTNMIRLLRSGMQLDFGAVAKGYAVDLVWRSAREQGLTDALIDLGGNLRALGEARPGREGWLTGIRDPFHDSRLVAKVLLRDGEAVATSGNYERFVEINGERCAHIIDGRTAMPVKGMAAVTVVAQDGATADALSTALFVLSVEEGKKLIQEHYPESLALWIPDVQPLRIITTAPMEARLQR
ncbi:MAG: FAD:protein FMN transferase [Kiritimatiellae bacterium]|nr:FAD:protein FMN transferase [Kiritimatiellia bacterium]